MDLANTMLHLQVKVTRANGNPIDAGEPVGPVNNWLHALFSNVDLSLNNTLVTSSSFNAYPYRAFIETLLSYGSDAKSTQMTNQLWYKDKASRMHATELAAGPDPNPGFVTRREYISNSRVVDMIGRLHVDMFLQDKFLINGVDVKLRLVRSKPEFALLAAGANEYLITVVNASLFVKKATIAPAVQKAHILALDRTTVKYSLRPRRNQGVLHSHGRSVAHAREPVPRRPAETSSYCAASTTTPTTARTPQTRFTPRTTPSASSPCTSTVVRYPPNPSSPTSQTTSSPGATRACSPRPARCGRTRGTV